MLNPSNVKFDGPWWSSGQYSRPAKVYILDKNEAIIGIQKEATVGLCLGKIVPARYLIKTTN